MATIFEFPHRTLVEISLRALLKNLTYLRIRSGKEVIPVVKADAYGHGMIPISKALVFRGDCQCLAVATLNEALALREVLPEHVGILVLSGFFPHQIDVYLHKHLTPVIHSLFQLESLVGKSELPAIHLKLDTGMHRLGICQNELSDAMRLLEKLPIKLSGLMSHLASSEDESSTYTERQLDLFNEFYTQIQSKKLLKSDAKIHIGNSGAILRNKNLKCTNSVRSGISLYGVSPNPTLLGSKALVPILQWKTRLISFKEIKKGEGIGYGLTYEAESSQKIGYLPIGYADGFPRVLSNKAQVLVGGERASVRGCVSMDLTAVDVSSIKNPKEGTSVTIIGKDGKDEISAWEIARWAGTIPYEIFCGLSARVSRIYSDT